jgi:ribosomal protein L40E
VSPETKSSSKERLNYATKKCPECYAHLPLRAKQCHACNAKVGDVDKLGFAEKPVDWLGYVVAVISIVVFAVFMWWAFFVE